MSSPLRQVLRVAVLNNPGRRGLHNRHDCTWHVDVKLVRPAVFSSERLCFTSIARENRDDYVPMFSRFLASATKNTAIDVQVKLQAVTPVSLCFGGECLSHLFYSPS